jgi:hypothetical protein
MFLPTQVAPLLVVLAGLSLIVGKKNLASALLVSVLAMAFAPVVLGPVIAALPGWVLVLALPLLGVMLVGTLVSAAFGRRVYEEALGHWLARLLMPLWLIATAIIVLLLFL